MWINQAREAAANSLSSRGPAERGTGGLAGWLFRRLGPATRKKPRLKLLERITLGPRQTLSLIEAEGKRLLVATSPEGAAAFYSLDEPKTRTLPSGVARPRLSRLSW